MFSKVLELSSVDVYPVDVRQHTAHGRVNLTSLGRTHPREGGVFEDTPIHVSHQVEWSPYDANEGGISVKKRKKLIIFFTFHPHRVRRDEVQGCQLPL